MSRRKHIIGFGLLVGATMAVPASAQPAPVPTAQSMPNDFPVCTKKANDGDQEIAKQKYIAARQDYEEGQYDNAIKRFRIAYDLDCSRPEVLLIVSSAFEKKGDKPAALAALEVYTQRAPKDSPDMQTTQTKIENLRGEIKKTPPPSSQKDEVREHTVFPWVVVGIGAAIVVGGIVLHLTQSYPANCDPDEKNEVTGDTGKCGPRTDLTNGGTVTPTTAQTERQTAEIAADRETAGNVRTLKSVGTGLIIGGAVVAVGGLVWHFLEPTGPKSTAKNKNQRQLLPSWSPGYTGVSYGGTF